MTLVIRRDPAKLSKTIWRVFRMASNNLKYIRPIGIVLSIIILLVIAYYIKSDVRRIDFSMSPTLL